MAIASAASDARAEKHRRVAARDLLTPQQLADLRERSPLRSVWLIAHAWIVILGSIALVAWWPNPLTVLLAVVLIGSRQLGLAILMHDGAHGCFSRNQKLNTWLSQWLCAYPIFAETRAYRHYHLQHHARTQQDDDPDLPSPSRSRSPGPATSASFCATSPARPGSSSAGRSCAMRSATAIGRYGAAPVTSGRNSARSLSPTAFCLACWRRPASGGPTRCCGCYRS